MKASEIISLKVISIWDCEFVGIVENILIENNKSKNCYLKIYKEETDNFFMLSANDVFLLSENIIFIKNKSILNPLSDMELTEKSTFNPIGSTLYDFNGKDLGNISDFNLNENFHILSLIINNNCIYSTQIFNYGKDIIILKPDKKVKINSFAPSKIIKQVKKDYPVTIQKKSEKEIEDYIVSVNKPSFQPERIMANSKFLINRKILENITLPNGEILFKKDTKINSLIIEKARLFGKLIELTQKSRN